MEEAISGQKCYDQDSEKENVLKKEVFYIEGVKSHPRNIPEIGHPSEVQRSWKADQKS